MMSRCPMIAVVALMLAAPCFAGDDRAAAVELLPAEMRSVVAERLTRAGDNADALAGAIREAAPEHREAVGFLVAHMPEGDLKSLGKDYLLSNVRYAYLAREATPWAAKIPKQLFFEDVLPYASVNERRDDWRKDFYERFIEIAKESPSAGEAVRRLNVDAFKTFKVQYHATRRAKPDQSPYESIDSGYASCTGLSIILIDAARAIGVPARMVGTPRWTDNSGNHSWVEVWDREWSFVGACEPSKLNEGWFIGQAAKADETKPMNRIYATSFLEGDTHFPMVWKPGSKEVPAEDVTRRYTLRRKVTFKVAGPAEVTVRRAGKIVAQDKVAESATFELSGNLDYDVDVVKDGKTTSKPVKVTAEADQVVDLR